MIIQFVLAQLGLFIIIIFLLRVLFSRQMQEAVKRLKSLERQVIEQEAHLKEEVSRIQEEGQRQLNEAKEQASSIIATARKESEVLRAEIENQASGKAQRIVNQGKQEIEKAKSTIEHRIKDNALQMACCAVEGLFNATAKQSLHDSFIGEIIPEMDKLSSEQFTVKTDQVKIKTAYALNDAQKEKVRHILSVKMSKDVKVSQEIDNALIAGFVCAIGPLMIDASLFSRLQKSQAYLRDAADKD